MIRRISLTTDFSSEGARAFHTALALAVFYRARLEIIHVRHPDAEPVWGDFPRVRDTLEGWGLLPPGARQEDVGTQLGVEVSKVDIRSMNAASGIAGFLQRQMPDLIVAASHGRTGINWWLAGSVAIETLRVTRIPALLLGPAAVPFIDETSGQINLRAILFPVATSPSPLEAERTFQALMGNIPAQLTHIHVTESGKDCSRLMQLFPGLVTLEGDVTGTILRAARGSGAGMIVMPTAGRHGFIDAMRGSVTQRILRDAECPILALPA